MKSGYGYTRATPQQVNQHAMIGLCLDDGVDLCSLASPTSTFHDDHDYYDADGRLHGDIPSFFPRIKRTQGMFDTMTDAGVEAAVAGAEARGQEPGLLQVKSGSFRHCCTHVQHHCDDDGRADIELRWGVLGGEQLMMRLNAAAGEDA